MKNKIICILMSGLLLCLPTGMVQASQVMDTQAQEELIKGDGYEVTESFETKRSKQTPCCLTVEMVCPKDFGLNSYVILMDDRGKAYRISLGSDNGYTAVIYLAEGHYEVAEASVYEDYKQQYPFEILEKELTLDANVNQTVTCEMNTEKGEKAAVQGADEQNADVAEISSFLTGLESVTMKEDGTLYYAISHKGSGSGIMEASGFATGSYDVVVRIIKTGVVQEAEYEISLDGGKNYIGKDVVAETCHIAEAGLTLYFKTDEDSEEFIEGDEYRFHVPETFSVTANRNGEANLIVSGHPLKDHEYQVHILSSGGPGKTRFTVEDSNGTGITDVIPENGQYEWEDGLTLSFSSSSTFEKGMEYVITVKSNDKKNSYLPLYILIAVGITGCLTAGAILGGRKEKESGYLLQCYRWRKDEKAYEE